MPTVRFQPQGIEIDVNEETKLLVAGTRSKAPIRFGCAACSCGTCAVKVKVDGELNEISEKELAMLKRLHLEIDGSVRMACQARVLGGSVEVDLDFQDTYDPE